MKYYVVWQGRKPGIYKSWEECKEQVEGFSGAKYKSFETLEQAKEAFAKGYENYWGKKNKRQDHGITRGIAVDAACSGNPGIMEYRGVDLSSGKVIFHAGPFMDATNNIGEFLAIVHALAWLKKKGLKLPVYSDSLIAISWVQNKKCKTQLERTEKNKEVFSLIERAENWLNNNEIEVPLIKWDTKKWGEIPADFGRK